MIRPDTEGGGGGGGGGGGVQSASDPIRKVSECVCVWGGGGGQSTSGPIQKVVGRGGGAVRFRSDAFVWHTLSVIINGYNFDRGGCSSTPPGYVTGCDGGSYTTRKCTICTLEWSASYLY